MGKMCSNPGSPCGGEHLILLNHKIFSESHSKYCITCTIILLPPPPPPPKKEEDRLML